VGFPKVFTLVSPCLLSSFGISNEILRLGFSSLQLHDDTASLPTSS
jgi:hypothetical protein